MSGLITDSSASKDHPIIKEFISLVEKTAGKGVLEFSDIQTSPFFKFWQHLVIYRLEEEIDDFRVILFGTHVTEAFGRDCTGSLMSEMGFSDALEIIHSENKRIVNQGGQIFTSGDLSWQNRDYKKYHAVRVPLQRNGVVKESLCCIVHS